MIPALSHAGVWERVNWNRIPAEVFRKLSWHNLLRANGCKSEVLLLYYKLN
jgi:hypothetical protein